MEFQHSLKKTLLFYLLFAAICAMLCSCGDKPTDEKPAGTPEPVTPTEATATPTPTTVPTDTPTPTPQLYALWDTSNLDISWIDPNKKLVAFTFDDGPTPNYTRLLDTLQKYNMHATFFVWGDHYNVSYKPLIQRVVEQGCELGNHSWSHPHLNTLSKDRVISEIEKTRALLESITGIEQYLVRPPYGEANSTVIQNINVPLINWSIDSADWNNGNFDSVYNNVMSKIDDGAIVLMHAPYSFTCDAVDKMIPELIEQGYQIVSVSELCAVRGYELRANRSPLSKFIR